MPFENPMPKDSPFGGRVRYKYNNKNKCIHMQIEIYLDVKAIENLVHDLIAGTEQKSVI